MPPLGMCVPYLFGPLSIIGDHARTVARRAAPFILSTLINNTFSIAFRADFFSHLCALPAPLCSHQPVLRGLPRLERIGLLNR
jgi:hypothetical protein